MLTKGEVEERLSKIQLGPDLQPEERKQYEDLLRKYIHLFAFSYKDLREVTMEQHKIELTKCQADQGQARELESKIHGHGKGGARQVVGGSVH